MSTPINSFQDILEAMERDPALSGELLQVPVRLDRIEGDIVTLKGTCPS